VLRLRVIDLETTGMAPPAEVIEIGLADVEISSSGVRISPPVARLFRPAGPIPPETMAVHHISQADIPFDAPLGTAQELEAAIWQNSKPDIFVAHNCEFERKFITEAVSKGAPWICTYKVSLHVWPDAPRHSNQVLRYWRGLKLDPALAMPPHRAGPDAWVTAHLLAQLLRDADTREMIAWTDQPRPMPAIGFGKHKGLAWEEVPTDYLEWLTTQTDMNADVLWYARQELDRRRGAPVPPNSVQPDPCP
jgi:exodeoxyribonuclease X